MTSSVTLDHVLRLAEQLSPLDKVRLIERVAPQLERDLQLLTPRRSLRGLWRGLSLSADDITAPRLLPPDAETAERIPGLHRAEVWMSDDFDAPLSL